MFLLKYQINQKKKYLKKYKNEIKSKIIIITYFK